MGSRMKNSMIYSEVRRNTKINIKEEVPSIQRAIKKGVSNDRQHREDELCGNINNITD